MTRDPPAARGFFAELKRRKVFRVGSVYVVAGWILLQLGDAVFEPLGVPEWLQANLIVALVAGFPVVLVLTWIFELTSKGLVRDPGAAPRAVASRPARNVQDEAATRIAVLPFVDMGSEQGDQYLGDGLAEEILNVLAAQQKLSVIARTSSFRFRGLDVDLRDLRDQLNVTHVLSGSVRRGEDQIRVAAQLIDVRDETHVWSESYSRTPGDVFRLQEDVAQAVAGRLLGALGIARRREWTIEPAAYDEYLLAANDFRGADFPKAIEHAERSIKLDAQNPLAHAVLAEIYLTWPRYGFATGTDELTRAHSHASRALAVDPEYPPARMARAMLALYLERDFARAFAQISALEGLQPNFPEWLVLLYTYANRYADAVAVHRHAARQDPLNPRNWVGMARRSTWLRRSDDAEAAYARVNDIHPNHMLMIQDRIELALRAGKVDEAERQLEETGRLLDAGSGDKALSWLPRTYALWLRAKIEAARGRRDIALTLARELEGEEQATPTLVAETYLSAGDVDATYRICDIGVKQFDLGMYDVARPQDVRSPDDPVWLAFSSDPRYGPFLERLGIDDASLARVDWKTAEEILG